jgi:transposase
MPRGTSNANVIATIGIDIGKNTFHVIGLDDKGAIILRHKLSRGQVYARLANIPPCLIGMEACVGAHRLGRQLSALGHDTPLMPARYVRPYSKGQKNDETRERLPVHGDAGGDTGELETDPLLDRSGRPRDRPGPGVY